MNDQARELMEALDEEDVRFEFADEFGVDPKDADLEIEVAEKSDYGIDYWFVEVDRREYIAFEDYNDAEDYAVSKLKDDFDFDPDMLRGVSEWIIKDNAFVTPTDIRMVANDAADWIYDLDDEEVIDRAGIDPDDYDEAVAEGREAELIDDAREALADDVIEYWTKGLKEDPIRFLADEEGLYSEDELISGQVSFVQIDHGEVAKDIISNDGVGSTLAGYDGEERETRGGMVYYREN